MCVSASSPFATAWVINPSMDTCPVRVRLTFKSHVDTAADQTEDFTWLTVVGMRSLLSQAATSAPDNYFQGATITATRDVRITPNTPVSLYMDHNDSDSFANSRVFNRSSWGGVNDSDSEEVNTATISAVLISDSGCGTIPGNGGLGIASALFGVNLGLANYDNVAGTLGFHADVPSAALVTPAGLTCNAQPPGSFVAAPGVQVIIMNNAFRQLFAPACFADIVTNTSISYDIRFYTTNQVGAKVGGLYTVTGTPYVVWSVSSGDGTASGSNLVVNETRGTSTNRSQFIYSVNGGIGAWSLLEGAGSDARTHTRALVSTSGTTNVFLDTICDAASNVVSVTRETRANNGGGLVRLESVVDPDGLAQTNRWWYDANGRVIASKRYTGSWQINYYDPTRPGVIRETLLPWLNSPLPTNLIGNAGAADHSPYRRRFNQFDPALASTFSETAVLTEEYVPAGSTSVLVSREREILCSNVVSRIQYVPGGANLITESSPDDENYHWTIRPDGTATIFTRVDDATNRVETTWEGVPNATRTAVTKGTRTEHRIDLSGRLISEKTWSVFPATYLISSKIVTSADAQGRPTRIDYLDGTYEIFNYTCCGIGDQRDRDGMWTHNTYNTRKLLVSQNRAGVVTDTDYDAVDRVIKTWLWVNGNRQLVSSNAYDRAGRLISAVDALGHTTTYAETNTVEGFTIRTTSNPDASTSTTRSYLDGQLESAYGTAVHPSRSEYGVIISPVGFGYRYTKAFKLGPNGETNEWTMTLQDMAGRTCETIYPDGAFSYSVFDKAGHLTKSCDPDGVVTLFGYNDLGEQEIAAADMNRNDQIDLAGPDRVTRTVREYAMRGTTAVQRVTTMVYDQAGSATSLTTSVQESSFGTRENWSVSFGLTNYSIASTQGDTNITLSVAPDASYAVSVSFDGHQQVSTNFAADGAVLASTRLFYDDAGRQVAAVDAFGILSSNIFNEAGQMAASIVQAPDMAPRTNAFLFDVMGRMAATVQPDGGVVTNQYYPTGELQKTWGSRTYPVVYTWDNQGRMATMQTFTNFAGSNGVATTTWTYHPQHGRLTGKTYQDGKGPTYTYTPAGRLATRTWARGVVTTYQYGNAGDLAFVTYSDNTHGVANTYDRLGRLVQVQDGSGERVLSYGTGGLQTSEAHANDIFAGLGVQRQYDTLLRLSGLSATVAGSGSVTNQASYGYDNGSRLSQVAFGSNTVSYTYLTNRALVGTITCHNGTSNVLITTKQYDGFGQITNIYSTVGAQIVAGHAYGYNLAGQRTNCVLADSSAWNYGYDLLGQVTNGTHRLSDGQVVTGQNFGYSYDDIGNRNWSDRDGDRQDYVANLLNQYTSHTVPGNVWIQGKATTGAVVRVNEVTADRQGTRFSRKLMVDNSTQPTYSSIEIRGVGTNGATVVTNTVTRHAFTSQTPEALAYDQDGNLTNDSRWAYTWDAENRLIGMETHASLTNIGVPRAALAFTYDSQSRRVRKQVFTQSPSNAPLWSLTSDIWFAYDGWNLIHEERRPDQRTRRVDMEYVWGLDLSGSMQGAGGIGGLLAEIASRSTATVTHAVSFACYDANGNLSGLMDALTGANVARYEYSPFGETLAATGSAAMENPFRFSTKYADDETGLLYYGNRFYIPALGRWISKDPSGEHGGHNLYAFVANNAISSRDALGLMRSLPEPTLDGPSETADDDDFYWWLDHSSNPNGDSWIGGAMALAEGAPGRILVTHHWANCSGDRQKVVVDVPSNNAKYSSRIKPGLSGIIVRPGGTRTIAQHERRHFDIARLHDRSYTKPVYLLEGRCVCKECVPVLKNYIYWYQAAADDLQEYADAQQEVDDYPNGVKRNGNIPIANAAAAALDVDIAHLNDAIGEMPSKCDNCADVRGLPGRR